MKNHSSAALRFLLFLHVRRQCTRETSLGQVVWCQFVWISFFCKKQFRNHQGSLVILTIHFCDLIFQDLNVSWKRHIKLTVKATQNLNLKITNNSKKSTNLLISNLIKNPTFKISNTNSLIPPNPPFSDKPSRNTNKPKLFIKNTSLASPNPSYLKRLTKNTNSKTRLNSLSYYPK